jgi:DNA-binding transcriptional ArsR family regulator
MAARSGVSEQAARDHWRRIIDECIAKALGNSFRQQILWILNERVASPSEIARELGVSLNKVCHHIEVLKDAQCIELAYERATGNTIQHFYKATSRAFLGDTDWPSVPDTVKEGLRATLLQNVIHDAVESVAKGIYDECEGSHMSWTPMILDEQGRMELTEILERSLQEVIAVQEGAKERLGPNAAVGRSYTVSILGYPSVGGEKRVGPPADARQLAQSSEQLKAGAKEPRGRRGKRSATSGSRRRARSPKRKDIGK